MEAQELLQKLDEKISTLEVHYPELDREALLQYMVEHKEKSPSIAYSKMTGRDIPTEEWNDEKPKIGRDNLEGEIFKSLHGVEKDFSSAPCPKPLLEKDYPNLGPRSSSQSYEEINSKVAEFFKNEGVE